MKTFLGDMYAYIRETQSVASHIFHQREQMCKSFVEALMAKQYHTVIITGSGTSNFSAQGVRGFIEKMTGIQTMVVLPTDFIDDQYHFEEDCLMIGISATGTSTSTIQALQHARQLKMTCMACTNDQTSDFAKNQDYVLWIDHGVEDVSPKTKSYVCELVLLFCGALEYARSINRISQVEYAQYCRNLETTIQNIDSILDKADAWYENNQETFKSCERLLVIGYGINQATIKEGALKILECGRFQTSCYELEEFMHGIYHSIDKNCYVLYLANASKYQSRAQDLYDYLSSYTPHQWMIGNVKENGKNLNAGFVDDEDFHLIEYILPLQVLSYRIAKTRGIDPNKPSDPLFHQKMKSKR